MSSSDDSRKQLAMQLATGFAAACMEYLPVIEEGVRRSHQKIGFSAKVQVWRSSDGVIHGTLSTSPPRIPTEPRPKVEFTLELDQIGQLELVLDSTPRKKKKQIDGG